MDLAAVMKICSLYLQLNPLQQRRAQEAARTKDVGSSLAVRDFFGELAQLLDEEAAADEIMDMLNQQD